jgi:hypothetical protein
VAVEREDLLLPLVDEAADGSGRTKRRTEVAEPGDFELVNHLH